MDDLVDISVPGFGPPPVPRAHKNFAAAMEAAGWNVIADYIWVVTYGDFVLGEGFWTVSIIREAPCGDTLCYAMLDVHEHLYTTEQSNAWPLLIRLANDELERVVRKQEAAR